MPATIVKFAFLLAMFGSFAAAPALAQDSAFDTRASHAVILDYDTGAVLFSKNGDIPMPPASMSKLMTALMVFEALEDGRLSMDDMLPVSETAWRRGGAASGSSTMFLDLNSRASVRDLLQGIIVQSGNDACIVVAEALGGTEENFSLMMTQRARELGLESANFANSTGWPHPEHRISAHDLARLAQIIIRDYPQYYEFYAQPVFTYNGIRQFNRNPLIGSMQGADGLKTGRTDEAGFGLTASAVRDGQRRIVVFNGMETERARADEAERLMRAAFTEFELVRLVEAGQEAGAAQVYMGRAREVPLRAVEALSFGVHRRDRADVRAEIVYEGPLRAPIAQGDVVAQLQVSTPDGRAFSVPLEAAADVPRKGLLGRAGQGLATLIRGG